MQSVVWWSVECAVWSVECGVHPCHAKRDDNLLGNEGKGRERTGKEGKEGKGKERLIWKSAAVA